MRKANSDDNPGHNTIDVHRANHDQIVTFSLDEPRYALHLQVVQRIVRAVEILPLPKAPDIVSGVIDVQGQVIPVIDVRKRFRLPPREMDLDDRFIIALTSTRTVALVVDSVVGVRALAEGESVDADQIIPSLEYIRGVAQLDGGLVLIFDLDRFLSIDEERALDVALTGGTN
ncbi:MAG: chemotaxis protein CheW [Methanomassiliicoccales archaeon]|nr:chemotaxis protein CheW [Methanomassiliicoccales archaeon]